MGTTERTDWEREIRDRIAADIHTAIMPHEVFCAGMNDLVPAENYAAVIRFLRDAENEIPLSDTKDAIRIVRESIENALAESNR